MIQPLSLWRQRLFVFAFPIFLSLPFMNRAAFVDDGYFITIASWLKDHPTQPYHFRADDAGLQNRGWEEDGFVRMVNPLAHHYYLAAVMALGGAREWLLRLACVLLTGGAAVFLFELARRWTAAPLETTALASVMPAQWLTAHSLLIDGTLVFWFLGAIYFFIRLTETDRLGPAIASGVFMGIAVLSKYPALLLFPLTGMWFVFRWKKMARPWRAAITWTLALTFLIGYSLWTAETYGRPHILAASARMVRVFGWSKIITFLVFFSGATLAPLTAWFHWGRRARLMGGLVFAIGLAFFASPWGGFDKAGAALLSLWIVTTVIFLGTLLADRRRWVFPRDTFVAVWILGFIAMMLLVMDWVAGRYYAIVVPAIALAVVRAFERRDAEHARARLRRWVLGIGVFSCLLAVADYRQADPSRRLGGLLEKDGIQGGDRHFYLGDSFTMSYLRDHGWIPCFPSTVFQKGDLVLSKEVTMPLVWFRRQPLGLRLVADYVFPSRLPLKVMDYRSSAGFYASVWGALPFTFSSGPWERFRVYEITEVRDVSR